MDAISGDRPVHDAWPTGARGCTRRPAWSTARCRRTTSRSSRRSTNLLYPEMDTNPAALRWKRPENPYHAVGDPRYPVVATTFRLTEHHTAGRDEPQPAVARRAAAGDVRRDRPELARRPRDRGRRLDGRRDRARRDRGARARDRAHAAAADRRPARAPDRAAVALGLRRRRRRATRRTTSASLSGDPNVLDPGVQGVLVRRARGAARRRVDARGSPGVAREPPRRARRGRRARRVPEGDAAAAHDRARDHQRPGAERMGFFTDTTVCIGCKACEVACKQWNDLPADEHARSARGRRTTTRRAERVDVAPRAVRRAARAAERGHLPIARRRADGPRRTRSTSSGAGAGLAGSSCPTCASTARTPGCLDACPTGALIRTEFDTVVLQPDVCNGCGYCVPSCPFGVVDRDHDDGRAAKCTLCYDRLQDGLEPACAKSCPTDSIQFGPYDELVDIAEAARHRAARARDRRARTCTARATTPTSSSRAGSARSSCSPSRPSATACRRRPSRRSRRTSIPATLAAMGAGLLAAAGVAAAFVARRARPEAAALVSGDATASTTRRGARGERGRRAERGGERGGRGGRADGRRCSSPRRGATRRWSFRWRTALDTSTAPDAAVRRRARSARGRRGAARAAADGAACVGPMHQGAGVDVGGPALLLVRRDGRGVVASSRWPATWRATRSRARIARRVVARARSTPSPVLLIMDLGPPGALPEHDADLQAALADVAWARGAWWRSRRSQAGVGRARPARPRGARRSAVGGANAVARRLPRLVHRRAARGDRGAAVGALAPVPRPDLRVHRDGDRRGGDAADARRLRACPRATRRGRALGRVETGAMARRAAAQRRSTSGASATSRRALEHGRARASSSARRSGSCAAGLALRFVRARTGRPAHDVASVLYLLAGLLFRYAWVGAGQLVGRATTRSVAKTARGEATVDDKARS